MRTRVFFSGLDRELLEENDICCVPISVGQPYHEGYKFELTLEKISSTFSKCYILVCDTLQKYSHAMEANDPEVSNYNKLTKDLGDKWIQRNLPYLKDMTIPYEIVRWDEFLEHKSFLEYYQLVEKLYESDSDYANVINEFVESYIIRLQKRRPNLDCDLAKNLSLIYLKEECAAMSLCAVLNSCKCIVYPNTIVPVSETLKRLTHTKFRHSMVGLRFKKYKTQSEVGFALEHIMNHIPGHIYWKDKNSTYLGCNNTQAKSLGLRSAAEIKGKTDQDLPWGKDEASNIIVHDNEVLQSGKTQIVEEPVIINGKKHIFLSQKSQLRNSQDDIVGILGVSLDITKQKELEHQLQQKTLELEESLSVKRRFLNNLSHEIRTPLHVIKSISEELYRNIDRFSIEETKSFLKNLVQNNNRLMTLLTNLLEVAKSNQSKDIYSFKKENFNAIINESIKEFNKIATINFSSEVSHCYIKSDAIKMSQVIRNLIDNALKFGNNNVVDFILKKISDKKAKLKIINYGSTVPEREKIKVFDPFYQASNIRKEADGSGLGLAICSQIIKAHNGKIWLDCTDNTTEINIVVPMI